MSNPALPSPPVQPGSSNGWSESHSIKGEGTPLVGPDAPAQVEVFVDDNDRTWLPFDDSNNQSVDEPLEPARVEANQAEPVGTASVVIASSMDWRTVITLSTHLPAVTTGVGEIDWSVTGPERWETGNRPQHHQVPIFATQADAIGAWATQQALANQDLAAGTLTVAQMDGIRHPRIPRGVRQTFRQAAAMHPVVFLPAEPRWRYAPDAKPGKRWRQQLNLIAEHIHTQIGERADSSTEVEPTPEPLIDKGQPS